MTITTRFNCGDKVYTFYIDNNHPTKIKSFIVDVIQITVTNPDRYTGNPILIKYYSKDSDDGKDESDLLFANKEDALQAAIEILRKDTHAE